MSIDWWAVLWLVTSIAGATVAAVGLREALRDLRALKGLTNGRRLIALRDRRNQAARLVIQLGWSLVGVMAALDERAVSPSPPVIVLIGGNILLTLTAALDLRDRRRIERLALRVPSDISDRLDALSTQVGDVAGARVVTDAALAETIEDTAHKVTDIHNVTVDGKAD